MATNLDIKMAYDGHGCLLQRIAGSLLKKAGAIRSEAVGTPNHANRLIWAGQVEVDPTVKAKQMLGRIMGNPTIASQVDASGDGLIDSVVDNMIDIFATGS
jgi:hypothetical protein